MIKSVYAPPAAVVKPAAVSNCADIALVEASWTAVVTRILYVVDAVSAEAGVNVATVLPPLKVGADADMAMQLVKLSRETCTLPEHAPADVCAVTVPVLMASLKVTAIVELVAMLVAPFVGVVLLTVGGVVSATGVALPVTPALK